MDCYPIDDYCKLVNEVVIVENVVEVPTEIGVFNGKKYSFLMVDGTPVIAIEDGVKLTFLMER